MQATETQRRIQVAPVFKDLAKPARYKCYYGGRGGAKSWAFARVLIAKAATSKLLILCAREYQSSIADSVHRLLCDQISMLGLSGLFHTPTANRITSLTGSEFIFKGLRRDIMEIKSTEGIDVVWVEEAQSVSDNSWSVLIPTIRRDNSELWVSFNTGEATDATYVRFVLNPPDDAIVKKVGYRDNPHFPPVLEKERLYLLRVDPDAHAHIWEGEPRLLTDACVFKGKFKVETFETPADARLYYGADWGFSEDPTTLLRCFIKENCLYIDYEAWGVGVDMDEIPELFDTVPGSRENIIRADNARPETISYVKKKGFRIYPVVKKWKNDNVEDEKDGQVIVQRGDSSIKDGISYMRKFEAIIIHERCKHTAQEFKLYSYKVDPKTIDPETGRPEILPIIVDKHNNCFVGDTLVTTDKGNVAIKNISVGDLVLTRKGYKRVLKTFDNGIKAVKNYAFANKQSLTGTDTHDIILPTGKKHISDVTSRDELFFLLKGGKSWKFVKAKNTRRSFLMACLTDVIRKAKGNLTESISGRLFGTKANNIISCFTLRSGSILTGLSKRVFMSIIKTVTHLITALTILSLKADQGTGLIILANTMESMLKKFKHISKKSGHSQRPGIEVRKEKNGIANTLKTLLQKLNQKTLFALNAIRRIPISREGFVLMPAKQLIAGSTGLMMFQSHVSFAERTLPQTNTPRTMHAQDTVELSCLTREERVYDLMIEGEHEYFANGVLVSNCIDPIRYALQPLIKGGVVWEDLI